MGEEVPLRSLRLVVHKEVEVGEEVPLRSLGLVLHPQPCVERRFSLLVCVVQDVEEKGPQPATQNNFRSFVLGQGPRWRDAAWPTANLFLLVVGAPVFPLPIWSKFSLYSRSP